MDRGFVSGLILIAGLALLATGLALYGVLSESTALTVGVAALGGAMIVWGIFALRVELAGLLRRRRGESVLFTLGVVAVIVVTAHLSTRFPARFDFTRTGVHSLSLQSREMLARLDKPVAVTFFHNHLMTESVELYTQIAAQSERVTVAFHDPTLNPAQARLLGVQFPGTAVMQSEDRTLEVNGDSEAAIINGILKVTQSVTQTVCFLDGHGEADPFSKESHDHAEVTAPDSHSHGIGTNYVIHEQHGLAKARHGLETLNYEARKLSLTGSESLEGCGVLVVAGPKVALLPGEVAAIAAYLGAGGNALLMLEPFVTTGLEPLLLDYGLVVDDTIVIDDASHFWTDPSAPAVTTYNRHQVTRNLPLTFFPGVRSLSPTRERVPGTDVTPLINTSRSSYAETSPDRAEFDEEVDRRGPATLMVVASRRPLTDADHAIHNLDRQGQRQGQGQGQGNGQSTSPTAGAASARSRIVVVGDSDFATNSFFHFLGNGNLFLNTVSYLASRENLIGIEPRTFNLPRLSVTNRQLKGTFVLSMLLVPALLATVGTMVWWRQR